MSFQAFNSLVSVFLFFLFFLFCFVFFNVILNHCFQISCHFMTWLECENSLFYVFVTGKAISWFCFLVSRSTCKNLNSILINRFGSILWTLNQIICEYRSLDLSILLCCLNFNFNRSSKKTYSIQSCIINNQALA